MTVGGLRRIAAFAILACLAGVALEPSLAQAADAPTPNKGDTAWMLTASVLVLLMTIPGLALFYGGLVRTKNMLSMLMQVFYTVCIVCIVWVLYGYSMAFSEGTTYNAFFGGFSKAFLAGVTAESNVETFTDGVVIPELVYVCFQMTFAAITPALIVGAMAERMKFSAIALFIPLWVTFVYFPIAHMVWYWAGPAATVGAAKAIAAATDPAAKTAAEAAAAAVASNAGLAFQWGAIDFAGGTVVHINSGIAALVGALMVGKRVGYGKEAMPPHSLTLTLVGGALLWVGWFGFNAGSALEASGTAASGDDQHLRRHGGGCTRLAGGREHRQGQAEPARRGHRRGGRPRGRHARVGLCRPDGRHRARHHCRRHLLHRLLGGEERARLRRRARRVRRALHRRHRRRARHRHPVAPMLGGTGIFDYAAGKVADYDMVNQVWVQFKTVCLTLVWSGIGTLILLGVVRVVIGLRPASDQEREGLDLVDHGERAYNY